MDDFQTWLSVEAMNDVWAAATEMDLLTTRISDSVALASKLNWPALVMCTLPLLQIPR